MIKTTINTTTLEGVAVEYYNKALKLAEELQAVGYDNLEIKKGETSWCDYDLYLTVDNATFTVSRNYKDTVTLSLYPHQYYSSVSTQKRNEAYKTAFVSNNVKVITKKKIDNAIKEELAYHECMAGLNDESLDKIQHYLSRIKQLEAEGYTIQYCYDYEKTKVTGGYIFKNGVQLSFDIDYSSGYVNEKLTMQHTYYTNKIEAFKQLSDNKYKYHD